MTRETHGRVVVTWPPSTTPPTALLGWGCAFDDADTGEQLLDVVAMSIQIGSAEGFDSSGWIEVELTRLVDADGKPIGNGPGAANRIMLTEGYTDHRRAHGLGQPQDIDAPEPPAFVGQRFRAKAFRYIVAEMRLAVSEPGVEPRQGVAARITPEAAAAAEHAHAFTATAGSPIVGSCSCGMTYQEWDARRLADEALRYAHHGGTATTPAGGCLIEDGGPELFIPEGAPGGYVKPRTPDGT